MTSIQAILNLLCALLASGFESDIISDLVSPAADEGRALDIKTQQFWNQIQTASDASELSKHSEVYSEVEAVIASMPAENSHVKELLKNARMHLQRADKAVLEQSSESSDLATEKLATKPVSGSAFSFLTGGQNFLSLAIKRFVGGSNYADQVANQVGARQGDVLPTLRGAASVAGNVLADCKTVSTLSFDVLKYDIYNKGVPKTPEVVKKAANKMIDAGAQTRRQFLKSVTAFATALTTDTEEKDINPSAKVTQSLLSDMQPIQPFGAQVKAQSGVVVADEEPLIIHEDR